MRGLSKVLTKSKILKDQELKEFYKSVFDDCDANNDGVISVAELKIYLETHEQINVPENVLDCLCNAFDKNQDKQFEFEEFIDMINNRTFKETFQTAANRVLRYIVVPPKELHPKIQRNNTLTGLYERQIKCRLNVLGMSLFSLLQIICFYTNLPYRSDTEIGPINETLGLDPQKRSQIYRYFTYSLAHSSPTHLFGNIAIQLLTGTPLEMVHSWRVIIIYMLGVIGGGLSNSVFDRYSDSVLVGGSGGGFALVAAHISVVIMNWREMSHPAVHLIIFGIVVIIEIIVKLVANSSEMDGVSYVCHAGGAAVGLLFGVNILRNIRVTKMENVIWYICLVLLILLFITFVTLDLTLPTKITC